MEKPGSDCEIQLVGVLRLLRCSQETVGGKMMMARRRVASIEDYLRTEKLEVIRTIFDDEAIKRAVGRELPFREELSEEVLVKAGQVTSDDLLRFYRPDYSKLEIDDANLERRRKELEVEKLDYEKQQRDCNRAY